MIAKVYNLPDKGNITIPCLNCIIFFIGHFSNQFLIATTVGYQSDSSRSRVSYINGSESNGVTFVYSESETSDALNGKFTINSSNGSMDVLVIGAKRLSKI